MSIRVLLACGLLACSLLACNAAPTVEIVAPNTGATVASGEIITFSAKVTDDDELSELTYAFSADPGGELAGELTVEKDGVTLLFDEALVGGTVFISLKVTDPGTLYAEDQISLTVTENNAPTVTFVSPAADTSIPTGVPVEISVQVADIDETSLSLLDLAWTGAEGPAHPDDSGLATVSWTPTVEGDASIGVTVSDASAATDVAALSLVVFDGDVDDDGYPDAAYGGSDCDDGEATISPSGIELCDGIDQDCNGVADNNPQGENLWYEDFDADGDGNAGSASCTEQAGWVQLATDCDDTDPSVHGGADEHCDYRDEDCDGTVDNDPVDATIWFSDADGDGWPGTEVASCEGSADLFAEGGDCDDADASVSPSDAERCDDSDVDEDCDGLSDDADDSAESLNAWYLDRDGDGFGTDTSTYGACNAPSGYVADNTDCDDDVRSSFPGATETCEDEVDNDCDGIDNTCLLGGTFDLSLSDGKWTGGEVNGYAGPCAWAGDTDGDGIEDIVVGAWGESGVGSGAGAVYVVSGGSTGTMALSTGGARTGVTTSDAAGFSVAGTGDLDSDGYDDVIASSYGSDDGGTNSGVVYILSGPVTGSASLSTADGKLIGEEASDVAGWAVAGDGDTDGDGIPEVLVGAFGNDDGGSLAGMAYLLEGPISGTIGLSASDAFFTGESTNDEAGYAVAFAGDVDGDGLDDLIVGGPGADVGADEPGVAWVMLGPVGGVLSLSSADAKLTGEADEDLAGIGVSGAGDTDGDGYGDVLVGASQYDGAGSDAGRAYLCRGPLADMALSSSGVSFSGVAAQDKAGQTVAGGGDANGDGYDDVVVGAYGEDGGGATAGAAYLFYQPVAGNLSLGSADATLQGEDANDNAGKNVAFGGDGNGDGFADILVGAVGEDEGGSSAGAVYLVWGGGL